MDEVLHAFDSATGRPLWNFSDPGSSDRCGRIGRIAVAPDGTVFAPTENLLCTHAQTLFALGGADGRVAWRAPIHEQLFPAVGVGRGLVFFGDSAPGAPDTPTVRALDAATGKERWAVDARLEARDTVWGPPTVTADGVLYVASRNSGVGGYSADSGARLWLARDLADPSPGLPVGADGRLFVSTVRALTALG